MNRWVAGARPRTLPAAVVPVLVGTACARGAAGVGATGIIWWRAGAALVVALAIQVATNYVNDVADGVRGTDANRVGPVRLVAGGLASPREVKLAAALAGLVAALSGIALAVAVGWPLIVVGLACFAAGYFYTGGRRPYGYLGLGELFVFVFFGLVATVGSTYVQTERLTSLAFVAAIPVGLLITAILVANNLRDIPTDAVSGKKTLAVRMGDVRTRLLFLALVTGAFVVGGLAAIARPAALLSLGSLGLALPLMAEVRSGVSGRALVPVLVGSGRLTLVFGLLFSVGLWISA